MDDNADSVEKTDRRSRTREKLRKDDDLKAYRDRLTHGTTLKPEFQYELLSMFARNEKSAPFAMPALCFIFYIASMFWAPFIEATLWIAIVSLVKGFMLHQCGRLLALPRADVNVGLWLRRFFLIELLNGVSLAAFALIGFEVVVFP